MAVESFVESLSKEGCGLVLAGFEKLATMNAVWFPYEMYNF